jgi:hypothetical protein
VLEFRRDGTRTFGTDTTRPDFLFAPVTVAAAAAAAVEARYLADCARGVGGAAFRVGGIEAARSHGPYRRSVVLRRRRRRRSFYLPEWRIFQEDEDDDFHPRPSPSPMVVLHLSSLFPLLLLLALTH